mmetsp:Transcript_22513/g.42308  ORF Transcript_22513/g.42308 Transcript_22513/m.42308 type:complete len:170 (-) Transcript_22513:191-700(-)|eukprot:CAMPEP_0170177596 /NCGR_PEP_ID=MMETSP0040_2-20121228/10574_1 /TAXON_ID=641309 /ORGANISM="Lotharella oceanica, Strain CCMP622" /LENGTH=169 /DNA_ID=CAMNT_0010420285 /DNA_START=34 /DNA_END=543 /DNA_ORIENTATION=-
MSKKGAMDSFFKAASDFYAKHMSRSGHLKPYLPGGDEPAKNLRFPAPADQPEPRIPQGYKAHKYDIAYYKREGISTGAPPKPNVNLLPGAEQKLLPTNEEGLADNLRVLPMHLDKPGWWEEQEAYVEHCKKVGYFTAGISDFKRWSMRDYGDDAAEEAAFYARRAEKKE